MDQAARLHDFWMTLAQVIPVVGLAFGVVVSTLARAHREAGENDRTPAWLFRSRSVTYFVMALLLAAGWALSLAQIAWPEPWVDDLAHLVLLIVAVCGGLVLVLPALEYQSARASRRGRHEAGEDGS